MCYYVYLKSTDDSCQSTLILVSRQIHVSYPFHDTDGSRNKLGRIRKDIGHVDKNLGGPSTLDVHKMKYTCALCVDHKPNREMNNE